MRTAITDPANAPLSDTRYPPNLCNEKVILCKYGRSRHFSWLETVRSATKISWKYHSIISLMLSMTTTVIEIVVC